jgi:DNA-binding SARP family transcriptional activator
VFPIRKILDCTSRCDSPEGGCTIRLGKGATSGADPTHGQRYLAAEGGRHPRRELAELLWPQSEERRARADLRAVLHKLRKTLGEDSAQDAVARFFVIESGRLGLEPWGIDLDLEVFEAAVSLASSETSMGGRSAAAGERRELIGRLQGDLGLYRGELMEGFSLEDAHEFELWLEGERARWRVFGELCERLSHLETSKP